jgi:DNA-damage-inducible protein J
MGVRNGENLENPLQGPILARPTMKRVECDIGLEASEHGRNVAPHIDLGYAMPEPLQRLGAVLAGPQRDFPLGRPASHQNGDMLAHRARSRAIIEGNLDGYGRLLLKRCSKRTGARNLLNAARIRASRRGASIPLIARPNPCIFAVLGYLVAQEIAVAANTVVRARIDQRVKKEAEAVLAAIGLTVSDARVAAEKALPFEPIVPNKKTVKAIEAARRGELTTVGRPQNLVHRLNADD